jgi:hypothetical protein
VIAVSTPVPHRRLSVAAAALGVALLLAQGGCATLPSAKQDGARDAGAAPAALPANVEPPPPNVNLAGFPLPYRQGYADGCASAGGGERKDAQRFAADGNYRTGWQDGRAICAKK